MKLNPEASVPTLPPVSGAAPPICGVTLIAIGSRHWSAMTPSSTGIGTWKSCSCIANIDSYRLFSLFVFIDGRGAICTVNGANVPSHASRSFLRFDTSHATPQGLDSILLQESPTLAMCSQCSRCSSCSQKIGTAQNKEIGLIRCSDGSQRSRMQPYHPTRPILARLPVQEVCMSSSAS